jgi:hypothetical protein
VADNPVEIVRFWQAGEIFSPQTLPRPSAKARIRDLRPGDPAPWESVSRLPRPDNGKTWRHEVFGGVYQLSKVRDLLVASFGDDNPEVPARSESALFACTVDEDGFLIEGSIMPSACAWACGQLARGRSPFNPAEELTELASSFDPSPLRLLAVQIKKMIPDAVSGGVASIVASALAILGGPLAAAGAAAAGGSSPPFWPAT